MSSLAEFVSIARELAFRARRNWPTAKSVQLDGDDEAIRPPRIPQSEYPRSLYAPDGTMLPSEARSKSAYYSVIARAVARLPNNTRDARLALYDRAEIALTVELMNNPQISEEQAAVERLAFERAIIKIEGDARKKDMPKQSQATHRRPFTAYP
jgi:hypothetical protein